MASLRDVRPGHAPAVLLIFACTLMSPFSSVAAPPTFVGLQIPPYPSDCRVGEGAVLGPGPPYRLSYEHLLCGSDEAIILLRLVEHRDGVRYAEVIDEVFLSIPPEQQLLGGLMCSRARKSDEVVLAVGALKTTVDTGVIKRFVADAVAQAWRFDLEAERIEPIPSSDVSCGWETYD
jgi:hypothetical protein